MVLFLLVFQGVFVACNTEKNAFANKSYHYTTARFNGYFHGKEALKEAKKALYKAHKDNYEEILSVFKYGDKSQAESQYTALNRAIAKSTKMIDKHSMRFKIKGKLVEHNKMIDDCYLLLGQAQFYKMQYDSAENTFKYLLAHFESSPIFYDIQLELIKTLIYQKNYVDAETKFKAIEEDENFDEKLRDEHDLLRGLYYIDTEDFPLAIEFLEKAVVDIKRQRLKVRVKYILAQLYSRQGKLEKASVLFEEVSKKAVFYEMEFNAKLSLAKTHQGKNSDKIVGILNKMFKDKKNKDFQDQIYYTLAQVYERDGKEKLAVKNYKLSAQKSVNNPKQKSLSYLAVANYYFKIPEYVDAQKFYDSSLISLPTDYENYDMIKDKAENLTALVEQLNIISREDSLQRIAGLSEEERFAFIDNLIKEVELQEEAEEIALQAKLVQMKAAAATQVNTGGWLFDNSTLLASANAEFITVYGNRKLEDDWRRSDKSSLSIENIAESSQGQIDEFGNATVAENKTADFYMKNLPFTEDAVDSSNARIEEALYLAAGIFNSKLNDQKRANYYFEELNRRFPKNENRPKSLYQLFRNYDKGGDKVNAAINKSLVLSEFPSSEYALLIKYPNRGAEEEKRLKRLNESYAFMLKMYESGQHDSLLAVIESSRDTTKENVLQANFDMLEAFAVGQVKGKEEFEKSLRKIVYDHKGSVQAKEAQVILEQINFKRMQQMGKANAVDSSRVFDSTLVGPHYFAVIYNQDIVDSLALTGRIHQLNNSQYTVLKLKLNIIQWSKTEKIMLIQEFKSKGLAKNYAENIQTKVLKLVKNIGEMQFVISSANYVKLLEFKEEEKYLQFYQERY
ncbi:MAG: tetratricopeptide (TPR) repeat protein [Saprospiraceae bacterium]